MISKKTILGLTEKITLIGASGERIKVLARIDTGATSSSIDTHLAAELELGPVTRSKIIRSASGVKKRPIIKARVKMDGEVIDAEFSLVDRGHMTYPMLIGQNILKQGNFLIDPNKEAPR
ncbi:ATP-dependent zinc protease [Candidatus Woesearchaeota archaeon]|nr:ATP-dependent zinc protease [Candidatus Woesearchaeota archaeon]